MALFNDHSYGEYEWRIDADFREREAARREEFELADFYEPRVAVAKCDGSGIIEEMYFDVDQTEVIRCQGCAACDEELRLIERRAPHVARNAFHTTNDQPEVA